VRNYNDLDGSEQPRCYTCWNREQISFCWHFTDMIMKFTPMSTTGIKTHELVLKRMIRELWYSRSLSSLCLKAFQAFKAVHFADLSANNTMCGIIHVSMEVVATFTFLTVFNLFWLILSALPFEQVSLCTADYLVVFTCYHWNGG
jgi:hypothetical protein